MDPTFELVEAIRATDNAVYLLDQRQLPDIVDYLPCTTGQDVIQAIQVLAVRGAPAIGIAGAYGLWLESRRLRDTPNFHDELKKVPSRFNLHVRRRSIFHGQFVMH